MVGKYPMIPALKATIAHFSGDAGWRRMRPPLVAMDQTTTAKLGGELEAAGFRMPGLA